MDPLTTKTFKNLTKTEQVVMIINSGKELVTRTDEKFYIQLYFLPNIFTELWYENNKKTIIKISTTSKNKVIRDYKIDKERISELLHS